MGEECEDLSIEDLGLPAYAVHLMRRNKIKTIGEYLNGREELGPFVTHYLDWAIDKAGVVPLHTLRKSNSSSAQEGHEALFTTDEHKDLTIRELYERKELRYRVYDSLKRMGVEKIGDFEGICLNDMSIVYGFDSPNIGPGSAKIIKNIVSKYGVEFPTELYDRNPAMRAERHVILNTIEEGIRKLGDEFTIYELSEKIPIPPQALSHYLVRNREHLGVERTAPGKWRKDYQLKLPLLESP